VQGLPSTTGTQVYTAWAIEGDGAPVPIGEFTVAADGVATATAASPTSAPGAVLALTLEPSAGAATPTLPIIASGVTATPAG
jgi:anti-sigma-K factor RskA